MKQAKKRIPNFQLGKSKEEANLALTKMFMEYYYLYKGKRDERNARTPTP